MRNVLIPSKQHNVTSTSSSQAKGTNSTSFLMHVRKERGGVSNLGLRRCIDVSTLRLCLFVFNPACTCTSSHILIFAHTKNWASIQENMSIHMTVPLPEILDPPPDSDQKLCWSTRISSPESKAR